MCPYSCAELGTGHGLHPTRMGLEQGEGVPERETLSEKWKKGKKERKERKENKSNEHFLSPSTDGSKESLQ